MSFTKAISKSLVSSTERQKEADEDLAIVRKVQDGDVDAFDALILKYRERVYSVIYLKLLVFRGRHQEGVWVLFDMFLKQCTINFPVKIRIEIQN